MGQNWFSTLKIQLSGIHQLSPDKVQKVLHAHKAVFKTDILGYNGPPVQLEVKEPATPRFLKARQVPSLRAVVECELVAL